MALKITIDFHPINLKNDDLRHLTASHRVNCRSRHPIKKSENRLPPDKEPNQQPLIAVLFERSTTGLMPASRTDTTLHQPMLMPNHRYAKRGITSGVRYLRQNNRTPDIRRKPMPLPSLPDCLPSHSTPNALEKNQRR